MSNIWQSSIRFPFFNGNGNFLNPDAAYRLGTQLKSFEFRFQKHCDNAIEMAEYLENHSKIEKVLYPGLESHPTRKEAVALFGDKA